jgi:hypothetical protein
VGDKGGKGLKGETAIFQPKVEHWDGTRELQFQSILSAHSALCAMLQDKPLHGDRCTCNFFYTHPTVNVLLVLKSICHSLPLLVIFFPCLFNLPAVKLTIPCLITLLSFCLSLQNISWSHHFISAILGAFEKFRNTITSFVMSVCPSVPLSICCMEKRCSHCADFLEISYLRMF